MQYLKILGMKVSTTYIFAIALTNCRFDVVNLYTNVVNINDFKIYLAIIPGTHTVMSASGSSQYH